MTHPTDEELDEMARDLCHTGELSMPYRCEISDAIMSLRAKIVSPTPVTLAGALQVPEVQALIASVDRVLNLRNIDSSAKDASWQQHWTSALDDMMEALRAIAEGRE